MGVQEGRKSAFEDGFQTAAGHLYTGLATICNVQERAQAGLCRF